MKFQKFKILRFKKFFLYTTLCLCSFLNSAFAQAYDYELLIKRIQTDVSANTLDVRTLDAWVKSQNTDGSWSAFGYGKLNRYNAMNTSDNHLLRLWYLAAAVSNDTHALYNNNVYKTAIKKGLSFWYFSETKDLNWWYNQIYCPQKLGEILISLRKFDGFIPQTADVAIDEPEILALMKPQSIKDITGHGTGANAIDIGLHFVYRGILTQNNSLLEKTRDRLQATLADNIKADLVLHDHGPQIQISSYGLVLAQGAIRLASYLASSPAAFNLSDENFSKVISFIRETQIASIRGSSWDFSVVGRAVSRANALEAHLPYLQKMADFIDMENAEVYLDAIKRIKGDAPADYRIRTFNKHYWASDYTQHARKNYLFTVRNVSTRTVASETGNNENLKANYFSHGANFISVDGTEYKNIMPYWDWCMVPGSTFSYTTNYPTRKRWGHNFGTTAFVGGVSDGNYGATAIDMNFSGFQARKSWFFFEDEVVCIGAGVTDNSNRNVRTTVNQTKMDRVAYHKEIGRNIENTDTLSSNVYENNQLLYVRNGKIAYFFPQPSTLKYSLKSQSGSWKSINVDGSSEIESGNVFTLWFDHGQNPSAAKYSYIVVPNIDTPQKAESYDMSNIEIISNEPNLQAVAHKTLSIVQMIFYSAGSLSYDNRTITVNQACALMLRNGTLLTIADPAQLNAVIGVEIKSEGKVYRKSIVMPSGKGMDGSSITVDFEIS